MKPIGTDSILAWRTLVKQSPRVLAACLLSPVVLAVLLYLITLPLSIVFPEFTAELVPTGARLVLPTVLCYVVFPFVFAAAVLVRGWITRTPTDIVLAAFAVPCLLAAVWAGYTYYFTTPGVYWGGVFSIGTGGFLAVAVLIDAILEFRDNHTLGD